GLPAPGLSRDAPLRASLEGGRPGGVSRVSAVPLLQPPPGPMRAGFSRLIRPLGIAAGYLLAAKLGLTMAFLAEQVTVVWPPAGIALAAVLIFGARAWPGIWLAPFLANPPAHEPLLRAPGIATGNTLEALMGAWLLRQAVRFDTRLERLKDALALAVLAAVVGTTVSATIGTAILTVSGVQPWSAFRKLWQVWWIGDAIGILVVTPFLLAWADWLRRPASPRRERRPAGRPGRHHARRVRHPHRGDPQRASLRVRRLSIRDLGGPPVRAAGDERGDRGRLGHRHLGDRPRRRPVRHPGHAREPRPPPALHGGRGGERAAPGGGGRPADPRRPRRPGGRRAPAVGHERRRDGELGLRRAHRRGQVVGERGGDPRRGARPLRRHGLGVPRGRSSRRPRAGHGGGQA